MFNYAPKSSCLSVEANLSAFISNIVSAVVSTSVLTSNSPTVAKCLGLDNC